MSQVIDDPLELGRGAHRWHAWNQAIELSEMPTPGVRWP
jgi:hypothetical protein